MMQVSLVGYAVGGAFISLINFDVPYYLIAVLVATLAIVEKQLKDEAIPVSQTSGRIGARWSPANAMNVKR
jgi:hypothetical protein